MLVMRAPAISTTPTGPIPVGIGSRRSKQAGAQGSRNQQFRHGAHLGLLLSSLGDTHGLWRVSGSAVKGSGRVRLSGLSLVPGVDPGVPGVDPGQASANNGALATARHPMQRI